MKDNASNLWADTDSVSALTIKQRPVGKNRPCGTIYNVKSVFCLRQVWYKTKKKAVIEGEIVWHDYCMVTITD
jgi:hypothetical protein